MGVWEEMGRDGAGWDEMGCDRRGMGLDEMGRDGIEWDSYRLRDRVERYLIPPPHPHPILSHVHPAPLCPLPRLATLRTRDCNQIAIREPLPTLIARCSLL